jgi:hypothetical protein
MVAKKEFGLKNICYQISHKKRLAIFSTQRQPHADGTR